MSNKPSKWTLMFFFASDNILSPSMLSQIKAIKAAGYQKDTNVLLHFDPNEKGAPTRVFEINRGFKPAQNSCIGDSQGPLVSVLTSDDVTQRLVGQMTHKDVDQMEAKQALVKFLDLCREHYPAQHYMLFLIGHGMVVGGDAFLPDDNPISAIGLNDLGDILTNFSTEIKSAHDGTLELLGMHSCSMSGVEVAYQLQDSASYMLASQGISFIGAWPYRQMLMKIFNAVEAEPEDGTNPLNIPELVEELHDLCIRHSADFMVGGYAADLCLCTLNSTNVKNLDEPIQKLGTALKDGLGDPRCQELILLAHWRSQSYWQETYTDLYDYCLCLRRLFEPHHGRRRLQDTSPSEGTRQYDKRRQAIVEACTAIMGKLAPKKGSSDDGPVIRTDFVGSGTQYSHGLSIYFPWSEPVEDSQDGAWTNYKNYAFATSNSTAAWLEFLQSYFKETKRLNRLDEDEKFKDQGTYYNEPELKHAIGAARKAFKVPGVKAMQPNPSQSVPNTSQTVAGAAEGVTAATLQSPADTLDQKITPPDSGGGCICPSIKNYSKDFVLSPDVAKVFVEPNQNPGSNEIAA